MSLRSKLPAVRRWRFGRTCHGKLYYIIAYPDRASREKSLINGIAKDPAFLAVIAESEKDGKIVTAMESVLLEPTDYSKIK